jgi:hypothetical protein
MLAFSRPQGQRPSSVAHTNTLTSSVSLAQLFRSNSTCMRYRSILLGKIVQNADVLLHSCGNCVSCMLLRRLAFVKPLDDIRDVNRFAKRNVDV